MPIQSLLPSPAQPAEPSLEPPLVAPRSARVKGPLSSPPFDPSTGVDVDDGRRFLLFHAVPSWLASMVVHTVLVITMAMITLKGSPGQSTIELSLKSNDAVGDLDIFDLTRIDPAEVAADLNRLAAQPFTTLMFRPSMAEINAARATLDAVPAEIDRLRLADEVAPKRDLLARIDSLTSHGVEGRSAAQRAEMVAKYGGSEASERAVAAALRWLAGHQLPDGSWSFDHRAGICEGRCPHPGRATNARNGATALALLPFLGAGQTHLAGEHREVVDRGLSYLLRKQKKVKGGGSFYESAGVMYSHGMCAIVLCETYAMTQDPKLVQPAQEAIDFIVFAQDPRGGGWRYDPKTRGDTSVMGWQLMALKSAHMACLDVPPKTIQGASKFLNLVSAEQGAYYGYVGPEKRLGTTAIGLLCRMYLGWGREEPALAQGVEWLDEIGPLKVDDGEQNMYYNYYATQVMRHYEGEHWLRWNGQMRDWLVDTQSKSGHMEGSWFLGGGLDGEMGGRLYCTAMAAMILEVYYRHLPIYSQRAAEDDFPL